MTSENIIFLIDTQNQEITNNTPINDNFINMMQDFNEINTLCPIGHLLNNISDTKKCNNYNITYTIKELLLICEYYGISKELKQNKCNKEEIINVLIHFENNLENMEIVLRRQQMWNYINTLKMDKFMKKYVLW